jgi:hypothetical protein
MFTSTPTSSPDDAKKWLSGELANWKKIHSELNIKVE